ncbi:MAG: hypothetical protein HQ574_05440, partial [Chloroflexi bacterium]|nr:hypothetical protein [Chloroflexota bacterium]
MYGGGSFGMGVDSLFFIDKTTHQLFQTNLHEWNPVQLTSSLINAASPTPSPKGDYMIYV